MNQVPSSGTASADRVTEIVVLLRPARSRKRPESLTAAASLGDLECLQLFLDRGAKIEERSAGFASPLSAACAFGQLEAARWLIAHGALLDPPGAIVSPIQSALGKGNCEAAAVLLDAGLPIEHAAWGVMASATLGRLDMLLWLVGRGVELDRTYPRLGVLRSQALAAAEKNGKEDVARYLRGEGGPVVFPSAPPEPPRSRENPPRAAASEREPLLEEAVGLVRAAGSAAARWKATGPAAGKQELLISHAAAHGIGEIVIALLDAGAKPDFSLEGRPPPLTRAAEEAQVDVLRILLDRGASPNGPDGKTWLPLVGAVMSGEPEAVRVLLAAGANASAKPAGGRKLVEHVRGPFAAEIRSLLEEATRRKGAPKQKST